ncbi:glycosyltransferase family protein [Streptacidiphilus fuscans]|uniref:Glycosyltransferase n=1 Tax=Streptacidiphilus fuscans TaxID=2789292 RepID=A0A931BAQ5_9ACTN|nr:hypothetical protein [Streptacidiphilus fuscans]MBF9070823.1 hypothetical protein [Streptacidiphilus fuscans]
MDPDFASAHEADTSSIPHPDGAAEQKHGTGPDANAFVLVIRAHNDASRIALTVLAARRLPQVRAVLVLESGSTDSTRRVALDSGATLLADEADLAGYTPLPLLCIRPSREGGATHALDEVLPLVDPVVSGAADMALGWCVPEGRGRAAERLERRGLARAGLAVPGLLTGEYCLTSAAFAATWPPAVGTGELVGRAADLLRAGLRVTPVRLEPPRLRRPMGLRERREVARALRGRRSVTGGSA